MQQLALHTEAPIGIFDSGIGGLSVLRHIQVQLPHENLIYFADSGHAPYGGKPDADIIARTMAIAAYLIQSHCKALVVACNTATAAAIHLLRERYPDTPIVGVEPGLKPAVSQSKTRSVGVLATDSTLASEKYRHLRDQVSASTGVSFTSQACSGLVDLIENGDLHSEAIKRLVHHCVAPLAASNVDTLVLGCTHYPFVQSLIAEAALLLGLKKVTIVDTGEPVARRLTQQLTQHKLLSLRRESGGLTAVTTGGVTALTTAFDKLLQLQPPVAQIAV